MMRAIVVAGHSADRCEVRYNLPANANHDGTYWETAMKLIAAIVDERDVDRVMTELTGQNISLTHVSSTGGLLSPGNSTLLIGVDEEQVPQVMDVIANLASPRISYIPYAYEGIANLSAVTEVQVGGFLSFVLNVDHFEQV